MAVEQSDTLQLQPSQQSQMVQQKAMSTFDTSKYVQHRLHDSLYKTHDHQLNTQYPSSSYHDNSSAYSKTRSSSPESS